jgi:hypothetical protein
MTHRTASCSCGQLQAHVASDPIRVSVCHCLACQRRTGSVFGAQARFPSTSVTIKGTSKEFVRVGDEGTQSTFRFCPECGSTVYTQPKALKALSRFRSARSQTRSFRVPRSRSTRNVCTAGYPCLRTSSTWPRPQATPNMSFNRTRLAPSCRLTPR